MISASALNRHCGYAAVLGKTKERSPSQVRSLDAGSRFHTACENYYKAGVFPDDLKPEEQGWFDALTLAWSPPPGTEYEIALGLSPDGKYVEVEELQPHIYTSPSGLPLLTAGRADCAYYDKPLRVATVVDYKTGRYEVEHPNTNLQLWALALAYADKCGATEARTAVYYARQGAWKVSDCLEVGCSDIWERFADVRHAALLDDQPRTGPHCSQCWSRTSCHAFQALGKS